MQALAENFEAAVGLLADNQLHAALPQAAMTIVQGQLAQGVEARNRSPGFLAQRSLREALFPKDDPSLPSSPEIPLGAGIKNKLELGGKASQLPPLVQDLVQHGRSEHPPQKGQDEAKVGVTFTFTNEGLITAAKAIGHFFAEAATLMQFKITRKRPNHMLGIGHEKMIEQIEAIAFTQTVRGNA